MNLAMVRKNKDDLMNRVKMLLALIAMIGIMTSVAFNMVLMEQRDALLETNTSLFNDVDKLSQDLEIVRNEFKALSDETKELKVSHELEIQKMTKDFQNKEKAFIDEVDGLKKTLRTLN